MESIQNLKEKNVSSSIPKDSPVFRSQVDPETTEAPAFEETSIINHPVYIVKVPN